MTTKFKSLFELSLLSLAQSTRFLVFSLPRLINAFHVLLQHPHLWESTPLAKFFSEQVKELDWKNLQTVTDETIRTTLQKFHSLTILKLKSSPLISLANLNITHSNLTELTFTDCSPLKSILVDLHNTFPNLHRLDLDVSTHSVLDVPATPFQSLKSLSIRVSASTVPTLLPYILSCPNLESLDFTITNCSVPLNLDSFFMSAKCSKLKHLILNSNAHLTLSVVNKLVTEVFPSLVTFTGCKVVTIRGTELAPFVSVSQHHFVFSNVHHFLNALNFLLSEQQQQPIRNPLTSIQDYILRNNFEISNLKVTSLSFSLIRSLLNGLTSLECPLQDFPNILIAPQVETLTLNVGTDTKDLLISSLVQCFPKFHTLTVKGDLNSADFLGITTNQSQFRSFTLRTKTLKLPGLGLRGFTQLKNFDIQGLHVTSSLNLNKLPMTLETLTILHQSNSDNHSLTCEVSSSLTEFRTNLPISHSLFRNLILNNHNLHVLQFNNSLFKFRDTNLLWMLKILPKLRHFQLSESVECSSLSLQLQFLQRWPKLTFSLKELDFSTLPTIQDSEFQLIVGSNRSSLQSINISGCKNLTKKSLSDLSTLPILKELKLNALQQLNDTTLDFSKFLSLTQVELINCFNITSSTVKAILKLQKLTSLNLAGSSNVGHFWQNASSHSLRELDISGWKNLTEVEQVLDIVAAFPNLKYLNLSNCPVTSQNKTELIEILTSSSALVIETEKDNSSRYPMVSDSLTTAPQSTSDQSSNVHSTTSSTKEDQNVSVSKSSRTKRKELSSDSEVDQERMDEEQTGSDVEDFDIGEFDTEDIYNEDKLMKEAILRSSSEIKISDVEKELTKMKEKSQPQQVKPTPKEQPRFSSQQYVPQDKIMSQIRRGMPVLRTGRHSDERMESQFERRTPTFDDSDEDVALESDSDSDDDDNFFMEPPRNPQSMTMEMYLKRLQELEEEDIQRAIQLSLQEQATKSSQTQSQEEKDENKKPQ